MMIKYTVEVLKEGDGEFFFADTVSPPFPNVFCDGFDEEAVENRLRRMYLAKMVNDRMIIPHLIEFKRVGK